MLPQARLQHVVWNSDVYEPSDDSFALVDAVLAWLEAQQQQQQQQQQQGHAAWLPRTCLEVGCGSGYVIASVALALAAVAAAAAAGCCQLVATDISPAALQATAATLAAHQVAGVELVRTDLVAGLLPRLAGAVDLLLFNPPYVPTPDEEVARDGIARAWAGGHLGRRVTDRLLQQLPGLLSPRGHAFIVTVAENKPAEIQAMLQAQGFDAAVVLTRAADEECLQILHISRPDPAAAAAAAAPS